MDTVRVGVSIKELCTVGANDFYPRVDIQYYKVIQGN